MEEKPLIIEDDEINLLDYLIVLLKRKNIIIGITMGLAVITAIISLVMTPVYKAETKILTPQTSGSSMASQLLGQLGGAAAALGGASGLMKTSADLYIALIKSRPVLDRMVDRFHLMELYKAKSREDARQAISGALITQDDKKSGILSVGIMDKDPKMAADMANAFVEEFKGFTNGLAVTEAAQRRLFYEEQLKHAKLSLMKAEESLKNFQEKTGAVKIDSQAMLAIQGIATLRGQIAVKEVQVKVMKTYSTEQNPDLRKVESELNGLKSEVSKLESKGGGYDAITPTGRMPSLGVEYAREMRNLKISESIYDLMLKQYESAKLDEARDATVIQVIEKAIPPERRIKPKRTQMVLIAAVTGFFFSVFAAFFMEYIEKASKDAENRERFEEIKANIYFGKRRKS